MSPSASQLCALAILASARPASAQTLPGRERRFELHRGLRFERREALQREQHRVSLSIEERASLDEIGDACWSAFGGAARDRTSLARVAASRVRYSAAPLIRACERAFSGDDNALACLEALPRGPYDPAQLVSYCDQQSAGDDAALTCLHGFR